MGPVPQRLQRTFWGLYGRFVWDALPAASKEPQVTRIVELLEGRRVTPAERVLDAGCGTGNYAVALAQAGFYVTGVDYAAGMLARARAKVTDDLREVLSFQPADLNAELGFPDACFDHILNISVLQAAVDPAFTLSELRRVLRPGGTLLLLHVPRPASHDLPLREVLQRRAERLGVRALWRLPLVAAKAWAERSGTTRYWTGRELQDMLAAGQFEVLSVDSGPPIVIVAEKKGVEDNVS